MKIITVKQNYSPFVEEVVNFIQSGGVLKIKPFTDSSVEVIHDFDEAIEFPFLQREWNRFTEKDWEVMESLPIEDQLLCWNDVKAYGRRAIYENKLEDLYINAVFESAQLLHPVLWDSLLATVSPLYHDALSEIESDLYYCALTRALLGKSNNFHERLFALYKQGVWPCGWKGNLKNGTYIVFKPE